MVSTLGQGCSPQASGARGGPSTYTPGCEGLTGAREQEEDPPGAEESEPIPRQEVAGGRRGASGPEASPADLGVWS